MVNVTTPDINIAGPASATIPDTVVAQSFNNSIYGYASPAGTVHNVRVGFPSFVGTMFLNVTLAAGNATWTGLQAGASGQHIILRNTDAANTLTLAVGNSGSLTPNQFQGSPGSYALTPGNPINLYYQGGSTKAWVIVP